MRNKNSKTLQIMGWVVPAIVAPAIFLMVQPSFAQVAGQDAELSQYLGLNDVKVGVDTVKGYQQVYFFVKGKKNYVTEGNRNSYMPFSKGQYVVWVSEVRGAGQIFRYNILTENVMQISSSSTNLKPQVNDDGRVAWERWVVDNNNGSWQIFVFNGTTIKQLTQGDVSVNPAIEGSNISYVRKSKTGDWREIKYSLETKKFAKLKDGVIAKMESFRRATGSVEGVKSPLLPNPTVVVDGQVSKEKDLRIVIENTPSITAAPRSTESVSGSTATADQVEKEVLVGITENQGPTVGVEPTNVAEVSLDTSGETNLILRRESSRVNASDVRDEVLKFPGFLISSP